MLYLLDAFCALYTVPERAWGKKCLVLYTNTGYIVQTTMSESMDSAEIFGYFFNDGFKRSKQIGSSLFSVSLNNRWFAIYERNNDIQLICNDKLCNVMLDCWKFVSRSLSCFETFYIINNSIIACFDVITYMTSSR